MLLQIKNTIHHRSLTPLCTAVLMEQIFILHFQIVHLLEFWYQNYKFIQTLSPYENRFNKKI